MEMIMHMDDSYLKLRNRLNAVSNRDEMKLDEKMQKMLEYLVGGTTSNTTNIIANRVVSQYEEEKGNITFGVVVENADKYYLTYILIFEKDKTYSNVLLKKFDKDKVMEAKSYFMELKDMIVNNDLNKLSKLIIDKLQ